jgi:hypothetical protein
LKEDIERIWDVVDMYVGDNLGIGLEVSGWRAWDWRCRKCTKWRKGYINI